ncbi:hypothetical protein H1R20_g7904, partial [Candolleomyces eurysporus]
MATIPFTAQDFRIDNVIIHNNSEGFPQNPLNRLETRIAAGAIYDSAERCDAPKCHPDTRIAVQDDLYGWIISGDGESEHPKKMKWVMGPAGAGKTAVMGSLSERCAADGILGATFFFASWSASINRRRKTALVTTIAYQLARHREDLRNAISSAVEKDPVVLEKNLHVQMETLVLAPLRQIAHDSDQTLRGAIIVDGLDECEAEQYADTGSAFRRTPARTNDQDQLEILHVLHKASLDPAFPFRILVASRPERVFREFFDPGTNPSSFAPTLNLNEDYNADADITLFLEAQLRLLRRRYNLPPSWPPPGTIPSLVMNASGQFIYAATVIRSLTRTAGLNDQLALILATGTKSTSGAFEELDMLYSHILESSPNAPLSVRWIRSINRLDLPRDGPPSALTVNLLLQDDPQSTEAEDLLGNLHSLIRIPSPSDQAMTTYAFYHQSLFDFLGDPGRCGKFYVEHSEISAFIWNRFIRACEREFDSALVPVSL